MDNIQEQLRDWAKETFEAYDRIAMSNKDYDLAFYNQSDLTEISESPRLLIAGINPNSSGSYTEQKQNSNWYFLNKDGMEHILHGNYCKDLNAPNSKSGWEDRYKWSYWRGLKKCISHTEDHGILDSDGEYIITNATFFNTEKADELPNYLLKETLSHTLKLIEITNPKHIIFLSGKKCFDRLSKVCDNQEFYFKEVVADIYVGMLNNRMVLGIPHPAYKSNEVLYLVSYVLGIIYNKKYDEITPDLINRDYVVTLYRLKSQLKRKDTLQWFYTKEKHISLVNEFFTEVENGSYKGGMGSKDNIAVDLYEDNGSFNIVIFHRDKRESTTRELIKHLWNGKVQYMPCDAPYKHLYKTIPADTPDQVIVDEMNKLLDEICNYRNEQYPLK